MVVARPWQLEPILADADARAFEAKAKKPQSRRGFGDFRNSDLGLALTGRLREL